jgi:EmrB/QacA subfamily drug resistance transporter
MAIARSIETFGFTAPILIDGMNRIVAGHGRLEAAKRLGLESVPVIRLEHLTDTQAKAYMLADNKLTDRSSWDDRKVAIVLKELSEIALDFEIEATGFEAPEIDLHIQSLESSDADAADEFEAPAGPPVSKLGDLWLLNDHRVLCGDALDPGAYKALLCDEKASSVFTDRRERTMAVGIWAATAGLGVALGPVVGGFLLDRFWWGSIFIVNVPLTAVALVAGRRLVPESRDPVARRIDWAGAGLSGVGIVAFVWAIIEAPSRGWTSVEVLGAGAFAAVTLIAFVMRQRRVEEPLLDVRLFKDARFTAATSTITVLFFALFGFLFLATQYLQFVLGYSPSAAGVRILPYAAAMIVSAPLSSLLVARVGTKRVVTTGMLLFSAGLAVAATVTTSTGYGRLAIALLLMGAGMGLAGAPATESIMGSLPPERANIGSAVNDTTRELGGALGVAIVGSIMSSLYGTQLSNELPDDVPAPAAAAAHESLGAAVQISGSVADAAREAFAHAMSQASIVAALVAALGAFIAWRYLPARGDAQHSEVTASATMGDALATANP